MIIKASATLRNHYASISDLAKKTREPIYITKNGDVYKRQDFCCRPWQQNTVHEQPD